MTPGTTVGVCSCCGAQVVVTDPHNAECPCGRSKVVLGAPARFTEPPKLRLVRGGGDE